MKNIFLKKISLFYVVVVLAFTILITGFATSEITKKTSANTDSSSSNQSVCTYKVKRLAGFSYVKPLLFVDNECESENLSSIKQSVYQLIENYKKNKVITSASVYLKAYNTNDWTSINPDEKFKPGSLLKVPELITFLRMNEIKPGILDKVIL
jgi:beta-lactamase class A